MKPHNTVLVVAPHPDDETLGCGGTILRHSSEGDVVHWLVVTEISPSLGFSEERVLTRQQEVQAIERHYGFAATHQLCFPSSRLDALPISEIVQAIGSVFGRVKPDTVYLPFRDDAHTDHCIVFDATASCTKSFRYPFIKRAYSYETLSETEFGLRPSGGPFRPNLFVDIQQWVDGKVEAMRIYKGEMAAPPFPRSEECIRAQAILRGSQAGVLAAESFMILKEVR